MSTLVQKINSGSLASVPIRATEACLSPDTTAPVSCEVAFGVTTIGDTETAGGAFATLFVAAAAGGN